MEIYEFRYFFDAGSGICLWSANDPAREKYGYPVDLDALGLPSSITSCAAELVVRFDSSLDWDCPTNPSRWTTEEQADFELASAALLQSLRESLPQDMIITDDT